MSLARNRKGLELKFLAEIFLIIVATGLILGVLTVTLSRADEKASEQLCRGLNAIRFGTKVETPIGSYNIAPQACKTIDKGDLPGKDYKNIGDSKKGAEAEIRDLMARCWWMWLEGKQPNMFDQSTWAILAKNKCFICYTFSLQKDLKIPMTEFAVSLNTPYFAVDSTDKCAPGGQGGKCRASCDASSTSFSREVPSSRCKPNEKCCIADDARDECENKGGKCLEEPKSPYTEYYSKWQCKRRACYIEKKNMASYYDYVQGTGGAGGGRGFILPQNNINELKSGKKYSITFVSPGNSPSWDTLGLGAATVLLGAGALASEIFLPILGTPVAITLGGASYYSSGLTSKSGTLGFNYIYISEYDAVKDKCAIEAGVGEK